MPQLVERVRQTFRQRFFRELYQDVLPALWSDQWLPIATTVSHQWDLARRAVLEAYEAFPTYRRRLEAAGLNRDTLWRDFRWEAIPIIDRSEMELLGTAVPPNRTYAWRLTGGTTGSPLRIPLTREAYAWYIAGTSRGLRWWGTDIGDRGAVLLPGGHRSWPGRAAARAKDWGLNWLREPVDEAFDRHAAAALDRIARFRPAFLYGYPSALARVAQHVVRRTDQLRVGPNLVVTTGEHLFSFQRRLIERAFGCPVTEEYGCSEAGCIAFRCPEGGLHVTAESVLLEVTLEGRTALPGEPGRALITSFRNRLIPLVRYQVGDLAVLHEDPCPCGRGLPLIRHLGRMDEQLAGDGRSVPAQEFLERLLGDPSVAGQIAAVRLVRRGAQALSLQVEREDLAEVDLKQVQELGAHLGYQVAMEPVLQVPRERSGKVRSLVDGSSPSLCRSLASLQTHMPLGLGDTR